MTLTEQLVAERRERSAALNEPLRREVDPNRFRSDADRARLAATDTARIAAEQALNDARRVNLEVERSTRLFTNKDGASLFFRDLSPSRMTPAARDYIARGRAAGAAIEAGRDDLQDAIRAHNAVVREIDAASAVRRQQAKREAGQFG